MNIDYSGSGLIEPELFSKHLEFSTDKCLQEKFEMSQFSDSMAKLKIDELNSNVETTITINHQTPSSYQTTNGSVPVVVSQLLNNSNGQVNGFNNDVDDEDLFQEPNGFQDDSGGKNRNSDTNQLADCCAHNNHNGYDQKTNNINNGDHDDSTTDDDHNQNDGDEKIVLNGLTASFNKNNNDNNQNTATITNNNNNNNSKPTPFPCLPGENLRHQETTEEYSIYLTNYRLYVKINKRMVNEWNLLNNSNHHHQQEQLFCLPINNIDSVEIRDLYFLTIYTKYMESFVITFQTQESATTWHKRLSDIQDVQIEHLFCFQFYKQLVSVDTTAVNNENKINDLISINQNVINVDTDSCLLFRNEFKRMNFNMKYWRLCELNKDFKFCSSYPECFIVPNEITDVDLESVANFRYSRRIPVAVWRHSKNGCVILRSSQPVVGWLGWRCSQDEKMLQKILKICMKDTQKYHHHQENKSEKQQTSPSLDPMVNSNGINGKDYMTDDQNDADHNPEDSPITENNNDNNNKNGQMNGNIVGNGFALNNGAVSNCHNNNNNNNLNNMNHSVEKLDNNEDQGTGGNKLLILDARSYTAAFANRALGGGCECPEYYTNCDVQFMGLNNIHSIRKSFYTLRYICELSQIDQSNWFTLLDNTKWLHNLAGLLKAAVVVVDAIIIQERPVLVHCSDGWDRTPQVIALAELMLDPYYRTIDGFKTLVEKEWLKFGHKFADRYRSSTLNIDPNERCPVFLQWVDCVHQLVKQFPHEFEFNVNYLMKLVYHSYSCLFGTFIGNNVQERVQHDVYSKTISLWSYFELNRNNFVNYLYLPKQEILRPSCRVKDIIFWNEIYVPISNNSNLVTNIISCNGICNTGNSASFRSSVPGKNDQQQQHRRHSISSNQIENNEENVKLDELQCQSQSKGDLNRSASYESLCDSKISDHFPMLDNSLKQRMRRLSDSCMNQPKEMNDLERLNSTNDFQSNYGDCSDASTAEMNECDSSRFVSNKSFKQQSVDTQQNGAQCFKNCNGHSLMDETVPKNCLDNHLAHEDHGNDDDDEKEEEDSSIPLVSSTESLVMFDVDGQIIGRNNTQTQLKQMINYHKKMIRCLTNQLKSKNKN